MPFPNLPFLVRLFALFAISLWFCQSSFGASEVDNLFDGIRRSVDGLETEDRRIRWDEDGLRVEEKEWWQRIVDGLNKGLFKSSGGSRFRRSVETRIEFQDSIQIEIHFFKNGTHIFDIQNGPLIAVDPDGQMHVDYRNGTVKSVNLNDGNGKKWQRVVGRNLRAKREFLPNFNVSHDDDTIAVFGLGDALLSIYKNGTYRIDSKEGPMFTFTPGLDVDFKNGTTKHFNTVDEYWAWKKGMETGGGRAKRFATMDELYMAHGYEFGQLDATKFGQQAETANMRSDDEKEVGSGDEQLAQDKSSYWNKPLYVERAETDEQQGTGEQSEVGTGPEKPRQQQQQQRRFANAAATSDNDIRPPSISPPPPDSLEQGSHSHWNHSKAKSGGSAAQKLLAEIEQLPPLQVPWDSETKEVFIRNFVGMCHQSTVEGELSEWEGVPEKILRKILNVNQPAPEGPVKWAKPIN